MRTDLYMKLHTELGRLCQHTENSTDDDEFPIHLFNYPCLYTAKYEKHAHIRALKISDAAARLKQSKFLYCKRQVRILMCVVMPNTTSN